MGFRDLVLFYVVTGVSLRWIATAAAAGPSSVVIWIGAFLCLLHSACAVGDRAFLALSGGGREFTSGRSARSAISPVSSPPGHIGSATCPISLPCFTSPPATRSTFATTLGPLLEQYDFLHRVLAGRAHAGHAAEHRRAQRRHVAAQRGRARHVDSSRHRGGDGGGGVASLRSGNFFHDALHDTRASRSRT